MSARLVDVADLIPTAVEREQGLDGVRRCRSILANRQAPKPVQYGETPPDVDAKSDDESEVF